MVFQDYLLFPHLSARDNVAFGPRRHGLDRAAAHAVADRWLDVAQAFAGPPGPGRPAEVRA